MIKINVKKLTLICLSLAVDFITKEILNSLYSAWLLFCKTILYD